MKKVGAVLLSLFLLLMLVPLGSVSVAAYGKTGDLEWYEHDGWLTISGDGAMPDYSYSNPAPWKNGTFSVVRFKGNITHIGEFAFTDCRNLEEVMIPSSVVSIGERAFDSCNRLVLVGLSDNVESIGEFAFYGCDSLKSIDIPNKVKTIEHSTFRYCDNLEKITLGRKVKTIEDCAFVGCTSLRDVHFRGSEQKAASISIGDENAALLSATWHYNPSEDAYDEGDFSSVPGWAWALIGAGGVGTVLAVVFGILLLKKKK